MVELSEPFEPCRERQEPERGVEYRHAQRRGRSKIPVGIMPHEQALAGRQIELAQSRLEDGGIGFSVPGRMIVPW